MADTEQSENREEPKGTTLSVEEWIEELNKYDRLHQYAKKRREESGEEKRKEPEENDRKENDRKEPNTTTLSTEEWIEELNKHDSFDQYAKRRKERREARRAGKKSS